MPDRRLNQGGFSFLGLIVILAFAGFLAGSGLMLVRGLQKPVRGTESSAYLDEARRSLFIRAGVLGALPYADTGGNGLSDAGEFFGTLPYAELGVKPRDEWGRALLYHVNAGVVARRYETCNNLKSLVNGPAGFPEIRLQEEGVPGDFAVVAVLVSGGVSDADGDGNVFDVLNLPELMGDNSDGDPRYLRAFPREGFDDQVEHITAAALYDWLKDPDPANLNIPSPVSLAEFNWTSCIATHCTNGVLDSDETTIDRGGNDCQP